MRVFIEFGFLCLCLVMITAELENYRPELMAMETQGSLRDFTSMKIRAQTYFRDHPDSDSAARTSGQLPVKSSFMTRHVSQPYKMIIEKKPQHFVKLPATDNTHPFRFPEPFSSAVMEKPVGFRMDRQVYSVSNKIKPMFLAKKSLHPYTFHKMQFAFEKHIPYPPTYVASEKYLPLHYPEPIPYEVSIPLRIPVQIPVSMTVSKTRPLFIPVKDQTAQEPVSAQNEKVEVFAAPQLIVPKVILEHIEEEIRNSTDRDATQRTFTTTTTGTISIVDAQSEVSNFSTEFQTQLPDTTVTDSKEHVFTTMLTTTSTTNTSTAADFTQTSLAPSQTIIPVI